jgi:beta-lactamase class A
MTEVRMSRTVLRRVAPALLLLLSPAALAAQPAADAKLAGLQAELGRLAAIAYGSVGVGIVHLESGRELYLNGDERCPMASTFKVPIALTLFDLVDKGRIRLDSMVTLKPSDLHPGSGTLSNLLDDPGVSLSLLNLTELMLLISDNSATDLVLKAVGGGPAVNARLASLGVQGISVDRPTIELIANAFGIRALPPEPEQTLTGFGALVRGVPDSVQAAARDAFYRDPRDTATPRGMARLLTRLWRKEALSGPSSERLLDIMFRCETGALRIKGLLPPGIRVAHKTGTLNFGVTNDVGIIELPDGAGHVVLTVFVKQARANSEAQERTIAQIGRAVYDYFLFNR